MAKAQVAGEAVLRRQLAENRLPRLVVLTGEEQRLKEAAVGDLVQEITQGGANDFDLARFDGAAADQEAFFAAAFAPPLFTQRRVVVVRHCEEAAWLANLPRYWPELPESTTLILVTGGPDCDGPLARLLQVAGEEGQRYDFPALRKREAAVRLLEEAERRGLSLAPEAAEALQERAGGDLSLLFNELEKLRAYLGPNRSQVETADVATVVGRSVWEHSFAFVDAVLTHDTPEALSVLQDLFAAGEAPQAILAQLAAQFRRVVVVKALGAEQWPGAKLLRPLELGSAWAAEKVRNQARGIPLDRAERALALILRADYRLKHRRGLIPEVELQVLAAELCRAPGARK